MGNGVWALLGVLLWSAAQNAAASPRALILQGDDIHFDVPTELTEIALAERGYAVTVAHHTGETPLSSEVALQAMMELGLDSRAGDSRLLVLHCHGSPDGMTGGDGANNHRCCLDSACTRSVSMADVETAIINALPATLTVVDRSCYSGNTVLAMAASNTGAARDTCVVAASSAENVSYIGMPEFADYLGAPEITRPRDMALYAQIQSIGRRPDLIDQRVFTTGCHATMGLRRQLSFLRDGSPSDRSALREELSALQARWNAADAGARDAALARVEGAYERSAVTPSSPWPAAPQLAEAVSALTLRLERRGHRTDAAIRELNILLSAAEDALCGVTEGPCAQNTL